MRREGFSAEDKSPVSEDASIARRAVPPWLTTLLSSGADPMFAPMAGTAAAAVTGPQVMNTLMRLLGGAKHTYDYGKFISMMKRLAPHLDEATEAWKMVGGTGPTKLRGLGSGVDAIALGVRPGASVLKIARPSTHMGFDPHQIADTAPRNVMLPVLEHGKFGNDLSWFVQPKARPWTRLPEKTLGRIGEPSHGTGQIYDQLQQLLEKEGAPWRIVDQHAGNIGRWAGKDWVIDLGSMKELPW